MKKTKITKIAVIALSSLLSGLMGSSLWAGDRGREWGEASEPFDQGRIGISIDVQVGSTEREASTKIEPDNRDAARHYNENEMTVRREAVVYRVWEEMEPVLVTYERLECSSYPGEGKGNWHGFFNAPKKEKAKRLADAVKGIGPKTATCVVEKNVFSSKPRSWSAFESAIEQANSLCGKGIYNNVIIQHGKDNMENLGYYNPEVCALIRDQRTVDRPVPKKVQIRTIPRDVRMSFANAPLLPSETETFSVSFDGFSAKVDAPSFYNRYTVQQTGDFDFLLAGERQRTTPSNSLTVLVMPRGREMVLRITDSDYIKGLDNPRAETMAQITVMKVISWWPDKQVLQTTKPISNGQAEFSLSEILGSAVNPGESFWIKYSLIRTNSRLNNESSSGMSKTQEYKR